MFLKKRGEILPISQITPLTKYLEDIDEHNNTNSNLPKADDDDDDDDGWLLTVLAVSYWSRLNHQLPPPAPLSSIEAFQ